MTDTQNASVTQQQQSATDVANAQNDVKNDVAKDDVVPYAKFRELLDEKKKLQLQFSELKATLDKIMAEKEEEEKKKLLEQKKFEELYQKAEKEKAKALELLELERKKQINAIKMQAFVNKIGGLKRKEYEKFINLDEIVVDEKGNIDEDSLAIYANKFLSLYPELISQSKNPPPSTAPKADAPAVFPKTYEELKKLYTSELLKST